MFATKNIKVKVNRFSFQKGRELKSRLLMVVNESGLAFMSHAVVGRIYIIRYVVGSTLIETRH